MAPVTRKTTSTNTNIVLNTAADLPATHRRRPRATQTAQAAQNVGTVGASTQSSASGMAVTPAAIDHQALASSAGLPASHAASHRARSGSDSGATMRPRTSLAHPGASSSSNVRKRAASVDARETSPQPSVEGSSLPARAVKRRRLGDSPSPGPLEGSVSVETDAEAIARLRAPTPEGEREAYLASLPENEPNLYSEEVEVPAFRVEPPLPAKTKLVESVEGKFVVEVDTTRDEPPVSYLELIPLPKSDREAVEATTVAMLGLLDGIRQMAWTRGLDLPLDEALPGVPAELAEGRTLSVRSLLPTVNYHTTFGVSLLRFVELLDHHPDYDHARLHREGAKIEASLEKAYGKAPPEGLRAFIKMVLYGLHEARTDDDPKRNVKGCFNYLLRADLRSICALMLGKEERAMARVLFAPWHKGQSPLFARALGLNGADRVMPPYLGDGSAAGDRARLYLGPTYDAFLASIVGPLGQKDLVSQLEGRDPTRGVGALGSVAIDRENGTVRVEARGHKGRLEKSPLNHHMVEQSRNEFNLAAGHNPAVLGAPDPELFPEVEVDEADAELDGESLPNLLAQGMHVVGDMYNVFLREEAGHLDEDPDDDMRQQAFGVALGRALQRFRDDPEGWGDLKELAEEGGAVFQELRTAMDVFQRDILNAAEPDRDSVVAAFHQLHDAMQETVDADSVGESSGEDSVDEMVQDVAPEGLVDDDGRSEVSSGDGRR